MAMVSGMPVFSHSLPRWMHYKGARCLGPQGDLAYQLDDGFSSFILPLPPPPVLFPRKNLSRKFAVLLMRSAYDAADELDFIAMDKFQMKFWKLRQSEVEPYTLQYRPLNVKYGDLTDPLYFDFISFAQFATISNEMKNGQYVFQERNGANGELQTVRRDASSLTNSQLPQAFTRRAGNLIYSRLLQGFEGESFNVPRPCPPKSDSTCLAEGISKLLQLFVDQGYALNANVEEVKIDKMANDLKLRIRLLGSSTLWGMRTLASRRASVLNNFDALAVKAFLEASSRSASFNIHFTDTYKEEIWTVGNSDQL
ncbi:hypothetical protein GOP47_0017863 [Adiantum capillus-veneris]|uniref:Uncharacterized protein n=1 Tax=Adiantum capillus-veneris TaxID=13818 RepID=A0A9D4UGF3_ADICA|nr:hypothetical protein GOP47_0017863 [Adiantum capillus-veneris]